jgi:hypothetical protein
MNTASVNKVNSALENLNMGKTKKVIHLIKSRRKKIKTSFSNCRKMSKET